MAGTGGRIMIRAWLWLRHVTQCLVLALFCCLPLLDGQENLWLSGSLFAFDLGGIPFADPVAMAQGLLGGLVSGIAPGMRLLAGGCLALCVAFFLGRIFCSWLCPYGLFSELVTALRLTPDDKMLKKRAFSIKVLLLAHGLGFVVLFNAPMLVMLSQPGQMSLMPQAVLEWLAHPEYAAALLSLASVPLIALCLELLTGKRLWCRFVCPQSVLLGLAASCLPRTIPGLHLVWQASRCTCKGESPCQNACKLGCNPRKIVRRDCSLCGDCAHACARRGGALTLHLGALER